MTARNYFFVESENVFRLILPGLLISAISHILIALIFLYMPAKQMDRRILAPINVSLVSLPGPYRSPQTPKGTTMVKAAKKPAFSKPKIDDAAITPPPPKEEKTKIVETPEVIAKTSLKKKTFKTGEIVKTPPKEKNTGEKADKDKADALAKTLKEMEKKVDAGRPDALAKALERIQERVDEQSRAGSDLNQGTGESGGLGNPGELTPIDRYKFEIMEMIQRNWALSLQLAGQLNNMQSVLVIKVMPDGEINDIWFEEKSGNPHLDESSHKAILKSNPLPPLPSGFTGPFLMVGIVFTPSGVQQ